MPSQRAQARALAKAKAKIKSKSSALGAKKQLLPPSAKASRRPKPPSKRRKAPSVIYGPPPPPANPKAKENTLFLRRCEEIAYLESIFRKDPNTGLSKLPEAARVTFFLAVAWRYEEEKAGSGLDLVTRRRGLYDNPKLFGKDQRAFERFVKKHPEIGKKVKFIAESGRGGSAIMGELWIIVRDTMASMERAVRLSLTLKVAPINCQTFVCFVEEPEWVLFLESHAIAGPIVRWMIERQQRELRRLVDGIDDGEGQSTKLRNTVPWRGLILYGSGYASEELQKDWGWLAANLRPGTPFLGLTDADAHGVSIWANLVDSKHGPRVPQARWIGGNPVDIIDRLDDAGILPWYGSRLSLDDHKRLTKITQNRDPLFRNVASLAEGILKTGIGSSMVALGKVILDNLVQAIALELGPKRQKEIKKEAKIAMKDAKRLAGFIPDNVPSRERIQRIIEASAGSISHASRTDAGLAELSPFAQFSNAATQEQDAEDLIEDEIIDIDG